MYPATVVLYVLVHFIVLLCMSGTLSVYCILLYVLLFNVLYVLLLCIVLYMLLSVLV